MWNSLCAYAVAEYRLDEAWTGTTETPDAWLRLPGCLDQLHDLSTNQHTLLGLVGKNGLAVHHHVQYTPAG